MALQTTHASEAVKLGPNMLLMDVQWFSHFRKLFQSSSDLNTELPHGQQNHLYGNIQGDFKQHPYKRACTNIYWSIIIQGNQKWGTTQTPLNTWAEKEQVV